MTRLNSYHLITLLYIFYISDQISTNNLSYDDNRCGSLHSSPSVCDAKRSQYYWHSKEKISPSCWGYEHGCHNHKRPFCEKNAFKSERNRNRSLSRFWTSVDFGLVSQLRESFLTLCEPRDEFGSSLVCTPNMQYCRARNLYVDFSVYNFKTHNRFHKIPFQKGQIGGHCKLNVDLLRAQNGYKVNLGTWYSELEDYSELSFHPEERCDEVVRKPTIFMKLDDPGNMFHHFCDFINLFISQHVNGSYSFKDEDSVIRDVNMIHWSSSSNLYLDTIFGETWKVFTNSHLQQISNFIGKRVCFHDVVFSMPPRNPSALYYNSRFPEGCHTSQLVRAFSKRVLEGLQVNRRTSDLHEIKVTFLSRSTKFRRVVNEGYLVSAAEKMGNVSVTLIDYNWREMSFLQQLEMTVNTDILIGMHGAGLTHFMFLPPWAVGFELFNCEDAGCYKDLAALSGIKYMTWEDHSKFEAVEKSSDSELRHDPKFWNYSFDVDEFLRLLRRSVDYVKMNRPVSREYN